MTLRPGSPRAKHRWALLGLFVVMLSGGIVGGVLAALPSGSGALFELDKNAINDQNTGADTDRKYRPLGNLASTITATATNINICQTPANAGANPPLPAAAPPTTFPFTIQIEAERMTVTGTHNGAFNGNCATKLRYVVTRGAGSTTALPHAANGLNNLVTLITVTPDKPGLDWNSIDDAIAAGDTECTDLGFAACEFVHDGIGNTIFTGGSTKDDLPVSGWLHKNGSVPDKDEIINAAAAKATGPDGGDQNSDPDQILYVMADRYGVDGATDMGFWFFKNAVAPEGIGGGQTAGFAGNHTDGDILLLSTFTQGGAVTTVRVFRWDGDAETGAPGQESGIFGDCVPGATDQNGCATVNDTSVATGSWDYVAKISSTPGWIPAGGFLEAGINLSDLGLEGCFSGFLAETRSSPTLDATLKDFAFGTFESCGAKIKITPDDVNEVGENHTFTVKVFAGISGAEQPIAGVNPVVDLTETLGADVTGLTDNCADVGTNSSGECTVTFTSNSSGVVTGHASADVSFGGSQFHVETDGATGNSGDAVKRFVDASISITPNDVNEVGESHQFTITVTPELAGTSITSISITPTVNPSPDSMSSTCADVVPAGPYTCTVTISHPTSGVFTANASVSITFSDGTNSDVVVRDTSPATAGIPDGPSGSGPAVKRYVDASISIAPDDVNEVGESHQFTITVVPELAGTSITAITITPSVSPTPDSSSNTCASVAVAGPYTCTVTISDNQSGVFTANASVSITFSNGTQTDTVVRDTDTTTGSIPDGPSGSGPAVKRYVDASVTISPNGVNEVGEDHDFTITVTPERAGTTVTAITITPSVSPTPDEIDDDCDAPALNSGVYTCTLTISDNQAGVFTANASVSITFSDGTFSDTVVRATDGNDGPNGSAGAVKRFVDASISITPNDVNEVGESHVFTVTVTPAAAGTTITGITITPTVSPAPNSSSNTCASVVAAGPYSCTVTINNPTSGVFTANASVSITYSNGVQTDTVVRDTDPSTVTDDGPSGSGPAVKRYVDASISITPDGVNEVGDDHEFTITVAPELAGTSITAITITPSVSPAPDESSDTCATVVIAGPYTCTLTISDDQAGVFTANASVSITFSNGTQTDTVVRATNGNDGPNGTGPAKKRFVDAYITIGPDATNSVGDPHTFTVNVYQDDGLPSTDPLGDDADGFGPVADGVTPLVSLTAPAGSGAVPVTSEDTCEDPGTSAGACDVTFTSATAGLVLGHAIAEFTLDGVLLSRQTDGNAPNSDDAEKLFVAGSIAWAKEYGELPQGGATFQVCRTHSYDLEADLNADPPEDPFVELAEEICLDPIVDDIGEAEYDGVDEDPLPGFFLVSDLPLGRYEVTETAAPAGFEIDPDVKFAELVPGDTNADLTGDPFVNRRPILKITGFGYTNAPYGDQPFGILAGTTTYTVLITNYGTADAVLTNSDLVVTGDAVCNDPDLTPNSKDLAGITIAVGATSAPITLTCSYDHPDPAEIVATLNVRYTTNGLERTASGSPATITFTVDAD